MFIRRILAILILAILALPLVAQDTPDTLLVGQPIFGTLTPQTPLLYSYTLAQPSMVRLSVISQTVQPTISVRQDAEVIASAPNDGGALVIALDAVLLPGDYVVEIGSRNDATDSAIIVVESETPITLNPLTLGVEVNAEVSVQTPISLYQLTPNSEQTLLFIATDTFTSGVAIRLMNTATNTVSAMLGNDLLGGVLQIPANGVSYQLEVRYSNTAPSERYSVCQVTISMGACAGAGAGVPTVVPPVVSNGCTVMPAVASVNIRSSASTDAPIVATFSAGQAAVVLGIAPGGFFYNIQFGSVLGWVANSVVTTTGDCAAVPVVTPPDFIPVPSVTPTPTLTPIPTATNTPLPTPSGPCLLTLTAPTKVYSLPTGVIDDLYDEVQSGQLIPIGRLADGSWYKTNYASAWVQTSLIGVSLIRSGDCSALPILIP